MSAPPYMKLYVADYLGDTHHLGALEHGAYLLLLMAMWRAGGTLPSADANLAKLARCTPEEWALVRPAVMPFFKVRGGRMTHKRLGEEIAKYEDTSGKRSKAGKTGAARKASKNSASASANASDAESNCTHNQNHNQIEEPPVVPQGGQHDDPEGEKPSRRKPKRSIPNDFPSQADVAEAQEAARKAGADADMAYQADRFRGWALGKDAKYADWPATWGNWVRRTIKDAPKRAVAAALASAASADDRWRKSMRRFQASGYWDTTADGMAKPGKPGCLVPAAILAEFGLPTSQPPGGELFPAPAGRSAA